MNFSYYDSFFEPNAVFRKSEISSHLKLSSDFIFKIPRKKHLHLKDVPNRARAITEPYLLPSRGFRSDTNHSKLVKTHRTRFSSQASASFRRKMSKLTHTEASGKASMVDVSGKKDTKRIAVASCEIYLGQEVFDLVCSNQISKGEVLPVARIAGIMAAKKCSGLIPLCHNILLSKVDVQLTLDRCHLCVNITGTVLTTGPTGVEMEALTAVTVAALTIYDMCKAVTHDMSIDNVRLVEKSGGRTGIYKRKNIYDKKD